MKGGREGGRRKKGRNRDDEEKREKVEKGAGRSGIWSREQGMRYGPSYLDI